MTIEATLTRLADAQERTASTLEAILAFLSSSTSLTPAVDPATATVVKDKPASTGSQRQRKNVEREEPVEEAPAAEEAAPEEVDDLDGPEEVDDLDGPAEVVYDEEQVRAALKNYRDINGSDAMTAVLKKEGAGAKGMATLKPEYYAAVMAAVK